jgi:hypothetical protein
MHQNQATLMHQSLVIPAGKRVSSAMDGIIHIRVTGFMMCIHALHLSGKCKSAPSRLVRPPCRNDEKIEC